MIVNLTYFKESGKFYNSGVYETTLKPIFVIWVELERMFKRGERPGLVNGHSDFHVLVGIPEHPDNHPHLLIKAA